MRPAAPLCLLTLALTACGATPTDSSEDFQGAQRTVAAVVEQLETTARDDDAEKICARLLSDRLRKTLEAQGTNCRTAVKEALQDTDSFDLKVDDVAISGERATVKVTSGAGGGTKDDTLTMVEDDGAWKIDALGS